MEGKLFAPLAYTIMIALLVSLVLSITLSPVLCLWALRPGAEEDAFPVRWAKRLYVPTLDWALAHPAAVLIGAGGLLAGSLLLVPYLGGEFIPTLDEGALTPQVFRLPDVSLENSVKIEMAAQRALREFPEVQTIVSKIGRSEIALEPMEPNESDAIVSLPPRSQWTSARSKEELVEKMRNRLAQIEFHVLPYLGQLPVREITPMHVLDVLRRRTWRRSSPPPAIGFQHSCERSR